MKYIEPSTQMSVLPFAVLSPPPFPSFREFASLFTLPTLQGPSVLKNSLKLVSEAEKLNTSELAF